MWAKIQSEIGMAALLFLGWAIFFDGPTNRGLPTLAGAGHARMASAFSQPFQPLPQTGASTASFGGGISPLRMKTSPAGSYQYFTYAINAITHQELGGNFMRSGDAPDPRVTTGTYEIRYIQGNDGMAQLICSDLKQATTRPRRPSLSIATAINTGLKRSS